MKSSMDIDLLVFVIILLVIIIIELSQDRAFIIAQSLFPKKKDVLGPYRIAMAGKMLILVISIYYLIINSN